MPLRFRSFVPYTLPGVLVLVGWWWYTSRKKGPAPIQESEEEGATMGRLASPAEGSNGMVDQGCTPADAQRRPSRDSAKSKERKPSGPQHFVAQIHAQDVKATAEEPLSTSVLGQRSLSSISHFDKDDTDPEQSLPDIIRPKSPISTSHVSKRVERTPHKEPEVVALVDESQSLAQEPANIALVSQSGEQEVSRQEDAPLEMAPVLAVSQAVVAPTGVVSGTVGPAKAERPEPEGEVAAEASSVSNAEELQVEVSKDCPSPAKPQLPSTPAPSEPPPSVRKQDSDSPRPETPVAAALSPPLTTSTPAPEASAEEPGPSLELQENGVLKKPAEASKDLELRRLAAGLITEVISAATQEIMAVGSCEEPGTKPANDAREAEPPASSSSGTLNINGRPYTAAEVTRERTAHAEGAEPRGPQAREDVLNGCLATTAWSSPTSQEPVRKRTAGEARGHRAAAWEGRRDETPVLAKLQAEEATIGTEDSGCSTCQSEDGVSGEDLHHSSGLSTVVPENKEELLQISGMSRDSEGKEEVLGQSPALGTLEESTVAAALTAEHVAAACEVTKLNGTGLGNDAEADQSGGSDVNSMDSVDSGYTLGAGEDQRSGSQSSQSQSSELIVWEIEVPKHLVGRLIGKQGRYVSFLKQSSGAKIYISTLHYTQEFQICHIEGTQQQVDKALALIGKKFKDLDLTNLYAPPALPLTLPSLPMTSWLLLPGGVTVEVIVVNIVSAGHVFVQQHTHPTYHALRSLDQQMFLCYSQPRHAGPAHPSGSGRDLCRARGGRSVVEAQVISFYKDSSEVEIRYVDYGGYDRVKIDTLRQIRSDFVTLPFQGTEVLLDNIAPLPGEDRFSAEANAALEEMTRGVALLAQVTNYDNNTGLPLVQMWNMVGDELVLLNRTLAERGFGTWVDSF